MKFDRNPLCTPSKGTFAVASLRPHGASKRGENMCGAWPFRLHSIAAGISAFPLGLEIIRYITEEARNVPCFAIHDI